VGYGDGEWRNIECNIIQNAEPTVADPTKPLTMAAACGR
jgi:hypothetical protein